MKVMFLKNGLMNIGGSHIYYIAQITPLRDSSTISSKMIKYDGVMLKKACDFFDVEFKEFESLIDLGYTCINPSNIINLEKLLQAKNSTFTISFYL